MKVNKVKTTKDTIYYLAKSVRKNGKVTTVNIETIGKHSELLKTHSDPFEYAKTYAKEKTVEENSNKFKANVKIDLEKKLQEDDSTVSKSKLLNIGSLFIKSLIDDLDLKDFFKEITKDTKIEYNIHDCVKLLTYGRILDPKSKAATFDTKDNYYENLDVEVHDIFKTLDILEKNLDQLQAHLYKKSEKLYKRDTSILYYDCTNYYFEINDQDDFRRFGKCKVNSCKPLVLMGLFMDASGLPLAMCIKKGNEYESNTVLPLEDKILNDFKLSKFVYCADAGLATNEIRTYNSFFNRNYVVTYPLKKSDATTINLALSKEGFRAASNKSVANLEEIDKIVNDYDEYYKSNPEMLKKKKGVLEKIYSENFYKFITIDKPIDLGIEPPEGRKKKSSNEHTLLVTFSYKYRDYLKNNRAKQIEKAEEMIKNKTYNNKGNSVKKFIKTSHTTDNGEVAKETHASIDQNLIDRDEKFDGYYSVMTSFEEPDIKEILSICKRRWEIEESFRILKTNFKARPIYHRKESRIIAHFAICYISLLVYRLLEKKLNEKFTTDEIIETLQNLNVLPLNDAIFLSTYKNSELLSNLCKTFNLDLEKESFLNTTLNKLFK